jgi:OTU-like cysteine protease
VLLSAIIDAANEPTAIPQSVIMSRNTSLDSQLRNKGLHTTEVISDGNCFFRSVSVSLYGSQLRHTELRKSVAEHVLLNYEHIFASAGVTSGDGEAARKCAESISKDGTWAAEDAILATADYLQRDIIIFVSPSKISPLTYTANCISPKQQPIAAAFYEPGHYRPVFEKLDAPSVMSEHCSGNELPPVHARQ